MPSYPFDMQLVVDAASLNVVANGQVYIYDPNDMANLTPLVLTDPNGSPLSQPLMSSNNGFLPAFIATVPQVKWAGAGFVGYFSSYAGLRAASEAAAEAAQAAESAALLAASAAANSASTALAPTDAQIDAALARAAKPSNLALDTDGVPYFSMGANTTQLLADTDGRPYFI